MTTIYALLLCSTLSGQQTCSFFDGGAGSGIPYTFDAQDDCQRLAATALRQAEGNPTFDAKCVAKDIPAWRPVD